VTKVADLPGGASRLVRVSHGVHGVWVNGVQIAAADGGRVARGLQLLGVDVKVILTPPCIFCIENY
jgi:hypothetical protein